MQTPLVRITPTAKGNLIKPWKLRPTRLSAAENVRGISFELFALKLLLQARNKSQLVVQAVCYSYDSLATDANSRGNDCQSSLCNGALLALNRAPNHCRQTCTCTTSTILRSTHTSYFVRVHAAFGTLRCTPCARISLGVSERQATPYGA
jgi:hypothetical protein